MLRIRLTICMCVFIDINIHIFTHTHMPKIYVHTNYFIRLFPFKKKGLIHTHAHPCAHIHKSYMYKILMLHLRKLDINKH